MTDPPVNNSDQPDIQEELKRLKSILLSGSGATPANQQAVADSLDRLAQNLAALGSYVEGLKQENVELKTLALTDPLTSVDNRRAFDRTMESEWNRGLREQTPVAVILLDIDHFKLYNDSYGHQGGDECLKQVGAAIKSAVTRTSDSVARYGGEEFAVVLPNTTTTGAATVAEEIRAAIEGLNLEHRASRTADRVTASMGVASVVPAADLTPQGLIERADQALYQSKENGRNQVALAVDPKDVLASAIQPQVERLWKALGEPETLSWKPYELAAADGDLTLQRSSGEPIAKFTDGKAVGLGSLQSSDVDAFSSSNIRDRLLKLSTLAKQFEAKGSEVERG